MPATVDGRPRPTATVHRALRQVGVATLVRIGIVAGTAVAAVLAVHLFGREYVFFDRPIRLNLDFSRAFELIIHEGIFCSRRPEQKQQ